MQMYAESAIRLSMDEQIHADVQRTLIPRCILCPYDVFSAFSSRLLFYGGIPFRMKKSVQISRIVSEIHINETPILPQWKRTPDPMLIPIPSSSTTHKEESRSDSVLLLR